MKIAKIIVSEVFLRNSLQLPDTVLINNVQLYKGDIEFDRPVFTFELIGEGLPESAVIKSDEKPGLYAVHYAPRYKIVEVEWGGATFSTDPREEVEGIENQYRVTIPRFSHFERKKPGYTG